MKKLAVLGPKGTYCDIAARKVISNLGLDVSIEYYDSIMKAANAVSDMSYALVPFENTLDGFVLEALDSIVSKNSHIVSQIKLPVDFAFVSFSKDISKVKNIYCQFKALGQCLEFINKYDFTIEKTNSNTQTYKKILSTNDDTYGAIIPMHLLTKDNVFSLVIPHIADLKNNETRFVLLQKEEVIDTSNSFDASIMVTFSNDKPGLLYEMSKIFHDLNINMKTIMSRPLKTTMGRYKFYIEASFNKGEMELLDKLLVKLNDNFKADLLGVYNSL